MLSKRKRASRCHEDSAQHLFDMYKQCRLVPRYGTHPVLRWLVLSQQYPLREHAECPMAVANVQPWICSVQQCKDMESHVVTLAQEADTSYIKYAAAFFQWWFRMAELHELPEIAPAAEHCTWLSIRDLERSLVVPDVRRAAIKIAQMLQIRAGERETVTNKSFSSALQQLRTGEWNRTMHQVLMYGTATDIYHQGLLDAVHMAIVEGRYRGRLNFLWVDNVVNAPSRPAKKGAWPLVHAHGTFYIVEWKDQHAVCNSFHAAYCTWIQLCMHFCNGIIAGRYDVRKCM